MAREGWRESRVGGKVRRPGWVLRVRRELLRSAGRGNRRYVRAGRGGSGEGGRGGRGGRERASAPTARDRPKGYVLAQHHESRMGAKELSRVVYWASEHAWPRAHAVQDPWTVAIRPQGSEQKASPGSSLLARTLSKIDTCREQNDTI